MTFKNYLLFLVFCPFIFSCTDTTQSKTSTPDAAISCINRVIAIDEDAGKIRNHACETQSLSSTVLDYVATLEEINFKDCPTEFTHAFKAHIDAWKAVLNNTDRYPDLRGEMHDLFDVIEQGEQGAEFKAQVKNIWDTWATIEAHLKKEE